jgi:hypothetical protein
MRISTKLRRAAKAKYSSNPRPLQSTHLSGRFRNQFSFGMPSHSIHHGPAILRDIRRKSLVNFIRYISAELKFKVRVAMVMMYVAGIAFSIGFFSGVSIS